MSDPTKRQDFTNTIKEILKRLRNLEGRGIANNMTLHTNAEARGINVINQNDIEMIRFGRLQEVNTNPILNFESDGIAVFNSGNSNNLARWDDFVKGCIYPLVPWPWQESNKNVIVTSGTFANIFDTWVYAIPSVWVQFVVPVGTDVGTTAEIKCQINGVDVGTTQVVPSGVTPTYWFKTEMAANVIGTGPVQINLQARRASGAGNVGVYQPRALAFGNPHTLPASSWEVL